MAWQLIDRRYHWMHPHGPSFAVSREHFLAGMSDWSQPGGEGLPISWVLGLCEHQRDATHDWEHHLRQDDLIARLAYSDQVATGIECYWRPRSLESGGISVEWLLSANTRLLDEQIGWAAQSQVEAAAVWSGLTDGDGRLDSWFEVTGDDFEIESQPSTWQDELAGQAAVWLTLSHGGGGLLLAAAAGDQTRLQLVRASGQVTVTQALNFGFLEKGVIRRARLLALWMPGSDRPPVAACQALQSFYQSPPPLTV